MLQPVLTHWFALAILGAYLIARYGIGRWWVLDAVGFPDAYLQGGRQASFFWGMLTLALIACGPMWPLLVGALSYGNGHGRMHWMIALVGLVMLGFGRVAVRYRERCGVHESLSAYVSRVYGASAGMWFLVVQWMTTVLMLGLVFSVGGVWMGAWFEVPAGGVVLAFAGIAWVGVAQRGAAHSIPWHGATALLILVLLGGGVYEALHYPRLEGGAGWLHALFGGVEALPRESAIEMFLTGLGKQTSAQEASVMGVLDMGVRFGFPFAVAFAGGLFGLPAVWQRVNAIRHHHLRVGLSLCPLPIMCLLFGMGILGAVAAGSGGRIEPAWQTAPLVLQTLLPETLLPWIVLAFFLLLQTTVDAHVEACAGNATLHGLFRDCFVRDQRASRSVERYAMLLVVGGVGCAWGIDLAPLPWLYLVGMLGATLCFPVLCALYGRPRRGWQMVVAQVCGMGVGVPCALYGLLRAEERWVSIGALMAWGVPGLLLLPRGKPYDHNDAQTPSIRSEPDTAILTSKTTEIDPRLATEPTASSPNVSVAHNPILQANDWENRM